MAVHDGHRQRLRERLRSEGLSSFEPHEALELLLFFAIPLRNVNPLAHELIGTFGSLPNVLSAPVEQLAQQMGMGKTSAEWLHALWEAVCLYNNLTLKDRPHFPYLSKVTAYGEKLFQGAETEQLWVLNMNQSGHLLHSALLSEGEGMLDRVDMKKLVDTTLRYHAQSVVLLQRRLPANMKFEEPDAAFSSQLSELLHAIDVPLVDNVLMCGHRHLSLRNLGILQLGALPEGNLEEDSSIHLLMHWLDGQ